ncbi:uncharacterized protein LOC105444689 isoform X1 [Strongylocentrotus purpuratus]|uniref:Netrin receptor UNC5 n=1 Tax=Strongylocentrotus purpuratus TaxID=7668 RepID=A0A7M7NDW1_STRPU|nr:uncharacterized protein LOC105444689 isoform X1 [Strongylocentrotus purpuratus]
MADDPARRPKEQVKVGKSIKQKGGNRSGDSTTKRADPSKISKTADQESSGSATIEFGSIKQKGGNRSGDSTTKRADPSKISKTADQESSGSATIEFGSIKQKGGNRSGDSTTNLADPSKISKTADQESSGSATIEFGLTGVLRHTRRLVLQDVRSSSSFRLRRGGKKSGRNTVIRGDAGLELHVIKWMSIDDETHLVLRDAYFLGDDISILAPLCPTVKHFSIDFHTIRLLPFTLMSTHMRVPMRSVITVCIKSLYCLGNLQETLSEVGNLFPDAQILDMQIGILNSPSDQAYSHEVYSSSSLRELKLRFEGRYDITTDNLLMDISTSCPNIVSLVLSGFGRCPSNKSGKEITSCKMLHLTKIHLESFGTDNRHRFETLTSIFYVFHVISPRLRFVEAKKVQLGGAEFASAKWSRTSSGYELQLEDASSAVPMADLMHLVSNELEEVTVLTFDRCNVDIPQSISHPPHSTREESSLQELKFLNVECPLSQTDINKLSEMYPYVQITVKHESQASHEDSKQGTSMPFKLKWKTSPSSPTSSMDEVNVVPIKMECCKRVGVKGGKLQLDSFGIELEIPPGAIDSEAPQDISLRVLTDTQNLGNNKEEMSVCFGVQCLAPDDLVLKLPVTYTIPHCAVITRYSSVKAVLYTGEGEYSPDAVVKERIVLSRYGTPSCTINKDVLKLKMNHFSWAKIKLMIKNFFFKGKKMRCRPFKEKNLPLQKTPVILRAHLYDAIKGNCELIKRQEEEQEFVPAHPEQEIVIQAAESDLKMTCYVKETAIGRPAVVPFDKLMSGARICKPFELDFTNQPDIVAVSLRVGQNEKLEDDLLFPLDFSIPHRRKRTFPQDPEELQGASSSRTLQTSHPIPDETPESGSGKRDEFEEKLTTVARRVATRVDIDNLMKALCLQPGDVQHYANDNNNSSYMVTLSMLRDWRKKQTKATECEALEDVLEEAGQTNLADELFGTS